MSLRQCTLLLNKFANVMNFTQERSGHSYLSTTESEDAMSLWQCTLLPSKFDNVIILCRNAGKQGSKLPVYQQMRMLCLWDNVHCYQPIFHCHEFYAGTQGSKLPVYLRIRGCYVSKTMYTATQQICQCQEFYTWTQEYTDTHQIASNSARL